ncbi:hypothetical protein MMC16_002882 [Acarospora aff. strigata]|nr:hypothetical protein [Acarospora aff. strigata]
MSEPIPESIPTSQDPRSKRPTKRRALTPTTAQATQLSALFAKPDREIPLPSTSSALTKSRSLAPPPEIVANVQGSSAGAGSGEFHVYKASRRREYERVRLMDEEVRTEKENGEFETRKEELRVRDEEKTRRNKAKREKMKARRQRGKEGEGVGGGEGKEQEQVKVGGLKSARLQNGVGPRPAPAESECEMLVVPTVTVEEAGMIIHDDD